MSTSTRASNMTTKERNDMEWDKIRNVIHQVYWMDNNTLDKTQEIVKAKTWFAKSERSWRKKLKEWGYDKRLAPANKLALAHKAEKRKRDEGKDTTFMHLGRVVDNTRIQSLTPIKSSTIANIVPDPGTPEDFTYHTPQAEVDIKMNEIQHEFTAYENELHSNGLSELWIDPPQVLAIPPHVNQCDTLLPAGQQLAVLMFLLDQHVASFFLTFDTDEDLFEVLFHSIAIINVAAEMDTLIQQDVSNFQLGGMLLNISCRYMLDYPSRGWRRPGCPERCAYLVFRAHGIWIRVLGRVRETGQPCSCPSSLSDHCIINVAAARNQKRELWKTVTDWVTSFLPTQTRDYATRVATVLSFESLNRRLEKEVTTLLSDIWSENAFLATSPGNQDLGNSQQTLHAVVFHESVMRNIQKSMSHYNQAVRQPLKFTCRNSWG